ncbi:hypothetical protein Rt10032_c08g3450 [Rhodotorula toruloides]|uniref:Uncharacterized protein n=1 Tax=Rhodotorula toruloides TaxID=5286 RepID=A0A511KGD1_RHOTO|nr:hypothetical protein Rt10032_c08g3450 [Rhodotorula toruloides]
MKQSMAVSSGRDKDINFLLEQNGQLQVVVQDLREEKEVREVAEACRVLVEGLLLSGINEVLLWLYQHACLSTRNTRYDPPAFSNYTLDKSEINTMDQNWVFLEMRLKRSSPRPHLDVSLRTS